MISSKIENLIVKYLNKSATVDDLNILSKWVEIPRNKSLFIDYVQTHYAVNYSLNNPPSKEIQELLISKIKKEKSIVYRIKPFLKYAAIFICILGLGYFYQADLFSPKVSEVKTLQASEDDITLELENGQVKVISNQGNEKITNNKGEVVGTQKGNQLDYSTNNTTEKLVYNELTVPYGRIFDLVLSDGTKIKLNSGTSIKYPIKFIEGKDRLVYLNGEAYFDVVKDEKHPFIVNADAINIRVLGTEFNLSSYPEDENINTVLVEGSVSVYNKETSYNKNTAVLLTPGHKAEWEKEDKTILIEEADISEYTAWIDGRLIFRDLEFKVIRKKLERKYNITIVNNNLELENTTFNAIFDIESIEEVLEVLDKNFGIQYEIKNNKVIIN